MFKSNFSKFRVAIIFLILFATVTVFLIPTKASSSYTIDSMDSASTWTGSSDCKIETDTTNKMEGSGSIKITALDPNSTSRQVTAYSTNTMNLDLSNAKYFEFNIYVPNLTDTETIRIAFMSDWINYYYTWIGKHELMQGWNKIRRSVSEFTPFLNPTWSNIFKTYVIVQSYSGKTGSINLDEIKYGDKTGTSNVLLTFDDSWRGIYNNAYPIMKNSNMQGTLWANRSYVVDKPNEKIMTISQFNEMYNDKWDISNHTVSHINDVSLLSEADRKKEYVDNKTWLDQNNWTRGSSHVCYPSGSYDLDLISQLKSWGFLSGRSVISGIQPIPAEDRFRLKTIWIGRDSNMTDICKMVDNAITTNSDLFVMFHEVEKDELISTTDTTHSMYTPVSKFTTLINYLNEKKSKNLIEVETISRWYNKRYLPEINITSPKDGATYIVNEDVKADWSLSGNTQSVISEVGTVKKGSLIDTSKVGNKKFEVTIKDSSNNSLTKSVSYSVFYKFGGFDFKNNEKFKLNNSLPLKFKILDSKNREISTAKAKLYTSLITNGVAGPEIEAVGKKSKDNICYFNPIFRSYDFDLYTKNLTKSKYKLIVKLDDGKEYSEIIEFN